MFERTFLAVQTHKQADERTEQQTFANSNIDSGCDGNLCQNFHGFEFRGDPIVYINRETNKSKL